MTLVSEIPVDDNGECFHQRVFGKMGARNMNRGSIKAIGQVTGKFKTLLLSALLSAIPVPEKDKDIPFFTYNSSSIEYTVSGLDNVSAQNLLSAEIAGIPIEEMIYVLGKNDLTYYASLLGQDGVTSSVAGVLKDIREKIGVNFHPYDIQGIIDLVVRRDSGDPILWEEAYDFTIGLYTAFPDTLAVILTQHGLNPYIKEA